MNVETIEDQGMQSPIIFRDENGNKCIFSTAASTRLSQYQAMDRDDYAESKNSIEIQNVISDPHPGEAHDLQKSASGYICMGVSLDLEALHPPSANESSCMHSSNQNFQEPVSLSKESLAIKSIPNDHAEESVPFCQTELRSSIHFAAGEFSKSMGIQGEFFGTHMDPEGTSSSDSLVTVINLGDTMASQWPEESRVSLVFPTSGEMCVRNGSKTSSPTNDPNSATLDTINPTVTNNTLLNRAIGSAPLSQTEDEVSNYIDLLSQSTEPLVEQGQPSAEWVHPHCSHSPVLEPFNNACKDESKKFLHSTPGEEEDKWPVQSGADGLVNDLCPLAIQSFDECSNQTFCVQGETLTKVQNIFEGDPLVLDGHAEVSERIQNHIPKLARAALPEQVCEATFVVFSPTTGEDSSASPTTGSKNTTFAVYAVPDEDGDGILKAENSGHLVRTCTRRTSLKGNLERVAVKPSSRFPLAATITKARKAEIVSFPKPNFKNVKPKVMSRPVLQAREPAAPKAAQRSPQLSTTPSSSSPSSSPRQVTSSIAALRRKTNFDRGAKVEAPTNKTHRQHFNRHFPSQAMHVVTHSENTYTKTAKAAASKQNVEQVEKIPCPTVSSTADISVDVTSQNSDGMLADKMEYVEAWVLPDALGIDQSNKAEQQDCQQMPTDLSSKDRIHEALGLGRPSLVSSPKAEMTSPLPKDNSVALKSRPTSKMTFHSRRGNESKSVHLANVSSPPRAVLLSSSGAEPFSPRGRLASAKAIPGSRASPSKSVPKSKMPLKRPGFRRTSSISSASSTQSDQSAFSHHSTSATVITKDGKWPSNPSYQNGTAGSIPIKPVPRPRVHSLKNTPKGAKNKLSSLNQCVPKSSGPKFPGKKSSGPERGQTSGPSGQNGPRNVLSAFSSDDNGLEPFAVAIFGDPQSRIDKGKQKTPKNSGIQTRTSVEVQPTDTKTQELAQYKRQCENQSGIIQQLKKCLASSSRKFEALTLVIQHLQSEREEVVKQRKELSLELVNLRGELVTTSAVCEKLEKDRNELQVTYEGYVEKLNLQHQSNLVELEERLKQFYTVECQKLQSICIEEAEKYKAQLQEQVDNLNITHENFKLELETSHTEKVEELKKEYDSSFAELKNAHESERKTLDEFFREKQEELEKKIGELQSENNSLNEKFKLEEQKRIAKEKANCKNPQIMYLEQELESLKAVLEIKNEKLHQQDIKLLKTEKLVENNTILVEKLRKVQQENEELKARMDKHMELSRQLSTEQAVLQESLEKESKVNKRLSMENEELIWKLHNGDLCSPRKLSPSTPPMPFQSPRNSSSFSSPTVSPR